MGNSSSNYSVFNSSDYIAVREFADSDNDTLDEVFNCLKNDKGIQLYSFANCLKLPNDDNFSQGILSIFANKKNIIKQNQFKSFYYLFKSKDENINEFKKRFIAELLFDRKEEVLQSEYFDKVQKYFYKNEKDLQILCDKYLQASIQKGEYLKKYLFIKNFGNITCYKKYMEISLRRRKKNRISIASISFSSRASMNKQNDDIEKMNPIIFEEVNAEEEERKSADDDEIINTCSARKCKNEVKDDKNLIQRIRTEFTINLSNDNTNKYIPQQTERRSSFSKQSIFIYDESRENLLNNLKNTPEQYSSLFTDNFYNGLNVKKEMYISQVKKFDSFNPNLTYICDCGEKKVNKKQSINNRSIMYNQMESKFIEKKAEKFDINEFMRMIKTIYNKEICDSLNQILLHYILFTLGDVFTFQIFKEILIMFEKATKESEQSTLLFTLLSFKNKTSFEKIALKELLINHESKFKKLPPTITLQTFNNIYSLFGENFSKYVDSVNIIPYIFFEQIPIEQNHIKNSLYYLIQGSNYDAFLAKAIVKETDFYAVDYAFLANLINYIEELDSINIKRPIINNDSIAYKNENGVIELRPGLQYNKDFIVIPSSIYIFYIIKWFGQPNQNIIRLKKIQYEEEDLRRQLQKKEDNEIILPSYNKDGVFVNDNGTIHEVEFYRITIMYVFLNDIYDEFKNKGKKIEKDKLIEELKLIYDNKKPNFDQRFKMSRKQQMKEAYQQILYNKDKINKLKKPITTALFYNNEIEDFTNELTFDSQKIEGKCIILVDSIFPDGKNGTYFSQFEKKEANPCQQIFINESLIEIETKRTQTVCYSTSSSVCLQNELKYSPIGLKNMGNTCYLNSTLQILINLPIMKEMFIDNSDTINTFFNNHNPNTHNCALADEFWEVLVERWQSKPPEADFIYNPSQFGEVVHDIDPYFEPFRQHDANELLLLVLNELNEEMNINKIKSNEKNIPFKEPKNAFENWCNYIGTSNSFITSLFSIQLQSILTCTNCNKNSISYENSFNLFLPIKEDDEFHLKIFLYRLPFRYKLYYEHESSNFKKINEKSPDNTMSTLEKYYQSKLSKYSKKPDKLKEINGTFPVKLTITINKKKTIKQLLDEIKKLKFLKLENNNTQEKFNDMVITEKDEFTKYNIPSLSNLLVFYNPSELTEGYNFIPEHYTLEQCIPNKSTLYIYEVLNSNGIYELHRFYPSNKIQRIESECINSTTLKIMNTQTSFELQTQASIVNQIELQEYQPIQNNEYSLISYIMHYRTIENKAEKDKDIKYFDRELGKIKKEKWKNNDKNMISVNTFMSYYKKSCQSLVDIKSKNIDFFEYYIPIIHTVQKKLPRHFFFPFTKNDVPISQTFLLVNNSIYNYNAKEIYEYVWAKFKSFLKNPNNLKTSPWWENKNNTTRYCYPFCIKVCVRERNGNYTRCALCPWYKFCTGCILDPFITAPLLFELNNILEVEWCNSIIANELDNEKIKYVNKVGNDINPKEKVIKQKLMDSINLYFEKEKIDSTLECANCEHSQQLFTKQYDFSHLPPILILTLQRFNVKEMFKEKIDSPIDFPLYGLEIPKTNEKYDLYGIIVHNGDMDSGHYKCVVNINIDNQIKKGEKGIWILFDDARYEKLTEDKVKSQKAYVLVYVNNNYNSSCYDYYKVLDNMSKNQNTKKRKKCRNDLFFVGEPVLYKNTISYVEDYKKGKLKLNTSNDYVSISEVEKTLKVPNSVELNSYKSFSVKSNNNQSEVSEPLQRRETLLTQSLRNSNIEDL